MKALFDTNILIDYLNGIESAFKEIEKYSPKLISRITWMEIMVGTDREDRSEVRKFLQKFSICDLSASIAEKALDLRVEMKLKLPDAIIYATAREEGCLFVTRNKKDFNVNLPDIREPYKIQGSRSTKSSC